MFGLLPRGAAPGLGVGGSARWPASPTCSSTSGVAPSRRDGISVCGAWPAEAFLVGNEFAHLHPEPVQSLDVMLPPAVAVEAIEAGWAEEHLVARRGMIPANAVMVCAPRDDGEQEVVEELVRASHAFARGEAP